MQASIDRLGQDGRRRQVRLTVSCRGEEDPGALVPEFLEHRLAPALAVYADTVADGPGAVGGALMRMDAGVERLMWAARDTGGLSWGDIALAVGRSRETVRTVVDRVRAQQVAAGLWRDESGLHQVDDTQAAGDRAAVHTLGLAGRRYRRDHLNDTAIEAE